MSKRSLWNAAAAAALVPVAAFSFANAPTGARQHLVASAAAVQAMTVTDVDAQLRVTRPGLLVAEPEVVPAELPEMLALHTATADALQARWQHIRDQIAAARARVAARRASARRRMARARRAAAERARRQVTQVRYQPRAVIAPAAPAVSGSWQQITAALAGGSAGCLDNIIERESGGRVDAANPSGAYGIPQALPGTKMASAGADWQTNPVTQIRWMVSYVDATYGGACNAWAHEEAVGSY